MTVTNHRAVNSSCPAPSERHRQHLALQFYGRRFSKYFFGRLSNIFTALDVELYELWDSSIDREATMNCKAAYEGALAHYFKGDWTVALTAFEVSEALEPSIAFAPTTPSAVLAARCRQFIAEGDPENWDGAFILSSK